jgi:DNA-binding SARP family transcriptional activator
VTATALRRLTRKRAESPEAKLRRLTRKRAESEEAWRAAIRAAHAEGMSLRAIAECVGVAHTRVLQIVRGE